MRQCIKCGANKPTDEFPEGRNVCKPCRNAQKNPEKVAAYNRKWRAANRERHLELQKQWRDANAEHRKRYAEENAEREKQQERKYRQMNAAKLKAYYDANADRIKLRAKLWNKNHPDEIRELTRLRRAKRRQSDGKLSHSEWLEIVKRFDGRCVCCGTFKSLDGKDLEADHIVSVGPLGSTTGDNIQPLCRRCNIRKGNRHSTDYRKTPFSGKGQQKLFG